MCSHLMLYLCWRNAHLSLDSGNAPLPMGCRVRKHIRCWQSQLFTGLLQGDAEDLPFPTDTFDRYVSAGSIEYWPEPQRGIKEAYRCLFHAS